MSQYVFLSYSHEDADYVQRLAQSLEDRGIVFWMDSEIEYGDRWSQAIENHLDQSAAVIVIMSVKSRNSHWVGNEVSRAQRKGLPLLPLLLDGDVWIDFDSVQWVNVIGGKLPPAEFYERLAHLTDAKVPPAPPVATEAPLSPGVVGLAHRIERAIRELSPFSSLQTVGNSPRQVVTIARAGIGYQASFNAMAVGSGFDRTAAIGLGWWPQTLGATQMERSIWTWPGAISSMVRRQIDPRPPASATAVAVAKLHIDMFGDDPEGVTIRSAQGQSG